MQERRDLFGEPGRVFLGKQVTGLGMDGLASMGDIPSEVLPVDAGAITTPPGPYPNHRLVDLGI